MSKSKYHLVSQGTAKFITGAASAKIVTSLKDAGKSGLTYDALRKVTRSPTTTLYVLAQRLRDARIVVSATNNDGERILRLVNQRNTHVEVVNSIQ